MIRVHQLLTAFRRTFSSVLGAVGLVAGTVQALPQVVPPPDRAVLESRVQLVREALKVQAEASDAGKFSQPTRVAQWLNWPNWNNWANWNNWNNWRNWVNWFN